MDAYEYHHVVGLEETNLVGNVYFVNHLRWQGRCRELFLRDHAPDVLAAIGEGLKLVTVHCECEYLAELVAFDEVTVRMRLRHLGQTQLAFGFEYLRCGAGVDEQLVATGSQRVACMRRERHGLAPVPVPSSLRQALEPYTRELAHARSSE